MLIDRSQFARLLLPRLAGTAAWLLCMMCMSLGASQALALTSYTSVVGTNVSFTGINEASSTADAEPLFDQPIGSGNQLLFFPPAFLAAAGGAGGYDSTGSQLQLDIVANGLTVIDTILFTEYGDAKLVDIALIGTAATGTYASISGFVTVLEDASGPIAPVVIPFVGTLTPSAVLSLPGNIGTTLWSGSFSVDVASFVPNAKKAHLSLDNDLYAFSEAGTSASIQKKVASGPVIVLDVIPEPTTALLLGGGLVMLSLRSRHGRA